MIYIYFNYLLYYWEKESHMLLPNYSLSNRLMYPFYPLLIFFNQINSDFFLLKKQFPNSLLVFLSVLWYLRRSSIQQNINISMPCWNFIYFLQQSNFLYGLNKNLMQCFLISKAMISVCVCVCVFQNMPENIIKLILFT